MEPARLKGMSLFAELDDEQLAEVAACTREVVVAEGETLAPQGENAYEFFVIASGDVEVRRDGVVIATIFTREFKQIEKRMPAIATSLRATMRDRVARTSF